MYIFPLGAHARIKTYELPFAMMPMPKPNSVLALSAHATSAFIRQARTRDDIACNPKCVLRPLLTRCRIQSVVLPKSGKSLLSLCVARASVKLINYTQLTIIYKHKHYYNTYVALNSMCTISRCIVVVGRSRSENIRAACLRFSACTTNTNIQIYAVMMPLFLQIAFCMRLQLFRCSLSPDWFDESNSRPRRSTFYSTTTKNKIIYNELNP